MSYRDFTLTSISEKFNITYESKKLFDKITLIKPSSWLLETLENNIITIDSEIYYLDNFK
ncbi:MAG: hypothetical protein U0457_12710 [Candidatus Sericytochromatia bacterium]